MPKCPRCGEDNPGRARFCLACGAALLPGGLRDERKVVSVLFADLVGFTSRSEQLDPEDVRGMQDPYWRNVRAEIERHGGSVEKFIGDAVVGVFGAPVAHEDDPERAVRAALAIRDWALEQEPLQVRIAVTTGEALVRVSAQPLAGEGLASGDVVNTASRLQNVASPNSILVDERTWRSTRDVIDFGGPHAVELKGKPASVRAWQVAQARSRVGADAVQHASVPLVGRERELELLSVALGRAREERSPQLLTLIGLPGIGKSRLVYELSQIVDAEPELVIWRQGRSLPYGDGVSFWALAQVVKAQAGILESDDDAEARAKLLRAVETLIEDASEAGWVEGHLSPLIGLGHSGDASADRQREAGAAWRRFLEALADWRPVVLVFEDVQWADDGLLDFVEGLIEWVREVPLVVVATARPELFERRPQWAGGKANATTLLLSPLSAEETARLVRHFVGDGDLAVEVEQTLVAHAAGNALYAEQYARMWQERGMLEQLPPPETVQGVIAARLDALPRTEKSLLQNAAVFGEVFWQGAILALDGIEQHDAQSCLHALERKEFIQRARRSSVEGEAEYAFRHVLIRDVAYSQVPRSARADMHERAAVWIESLGRLEDHAELLAHHDLSALDLREAIGESPAPLVERATLSLVRAAESALAINAFPAAAQYYERALQLVPEPDSRRPQLLFAHARALFSSGDTRRADALETAAHVLNAAGDNEGTAEAESLLAEVAWIEGRKSSRDEHVRRAMALIQERKPSPAKARVLAGCARMRMLDGERTTAIDIARDALVLAEGLRLYGIQAHVLITLGTARWWDGDTSGVADIETGLRLALEHGELSAAQRGYTNLAMAVGVGGDIARRRDLLEDSAALARRLGDPQLLRYVLPQLTALKFGQGEWDEALREADEFIAECEAGSPHVQESMLRSIRAWIRLGRDDVRGALADADAALTLARQAGGEEGLLGAIMWKIRLNMRLGRLDQAGQLASEALTHDPSAGALFVVHGLAWHSQQLGLRTAELAPWVAQVPDDLPTRRDVELALAGDFAQLADRARDPMIAAENHRRAAEEDLKRGRNRQAAGNAEKALDFYHSVRATRFIREAETLLETARASGGVPTPSNAGGMK